MTTIIDILLKEVKELNIKIDALITDFNKDLKNLSNDLITELQKNVCKRNMFIEHIDITFLRTANNDIKDVRDVLDIGLSKQAKDFFKMLFHRSEKKYDLEEGAVFGDDVEEFLNNFFKKRNFEEFLKEISEKTENVYDAEELSELVYSNIEFVPDIPKDDIIERIKKILRDFYIENIFPEAGNHKYNLDIVFEQAVDKLIDEEDVVKHKNIIDFLNNIGIPCNNIFLNLILKIEHLIKKGSFEEDLEEILNKEHFYNFANLKEILEYIIKDFLGSK